METPKKLHKIAMKSLRDNAITYNEYQVVEAKFVQNVFRSFFRGCQDTPSNVVKTRNVPKEHYIECTLLRGSLFPAAKNQQRGIIILLKLTYLEEALVNETPIAAPAPNILLLKEEEKLHNTEGGILEIEVRGQRHKDRCYFLVTDVETSFGVNIQKTIQHSGSSFILGEDYVLFSVPVHTVVPTTPTKSRNRRRQTKEARFFTYFGLMHFAYVARQPNARLFAHWAADVVYTNHIGTSGQRIRLASEVLGISVDIVRQFSGRVFIGGMPGIYLLRIARVKDVRHAWGIPDDIPDDWIIFKFGRTIGLHRRCREHDVAYKKLLGKRKCEDAPITKEYDDGHDDGDVDDTLAEDLEILSKDANVIAEDITLVHYAHIDPRNQVEAEARIREEIGGKVVKYMGKRELVALPESDLARIKLLFYKIKDDLAGCVNQLRERLKDALKEIAHLKDLNMQKDKALQTQEKQINAQCKTINILEMIYSKQSPSP